MVADHIIIFFIIIFQENIGWQFKWIIYNADNSQEMSNLIFLEFFLLICALKVQF